MAFENKVCVVTGGANGIGRCMVQEFLRAGASVAFIDTDEAAGRKTAEGFPSGRVLFVCGDIAEKSTLEVFAQQVRARFGRVDILINNACVTRRGILTGCGYEDFEAVLRVGIIAPYYLTRLFMEDFSQGASIVNISSTRATMSQPDTESYTAAKGGISALTHALAVSLSGRARVNAISPGWIDTGAYQVAESYVPAYERADCGQHPAGRVGRPTDIVKTAMFLCSDDASFITGENIVVDGGMTRLMIYHNDNGWRYEEKAPGKNGEMG